MLLIFMYLHVWGNAEGDNPDKQVEELDHTYTANIRQCYSLQVLKK